mmetsp:Transcript_113555/g.222668  ORF Transcript_113555/g.222668 Transcript_113555/m.222668 type:complete len:229 (-) Transcript_113555:83-769(-)
MASDADPVELIKQAEDYKLKGNEFFKDGNLKRALGCYHKVFCYVNGLQLPGEDSEATAYTQMMGRSCSANKVPAEHVQAVRTLKQSTHLNMAACYLKTQEHGKCLNACTKALKADAPTCKAYFRRAQAQREMKNFDEAKLDLEEAKKLDPDNAAVKQEFHRLSQALAEFERGERKKFAGMFNKLADEPRKELSHREEEVGDVNTENKGLGPAADSPSGAGEVGVAAGT